MPVLAEVRERDMEINLGRAQIMFDNKGEARLR
jgi:hypothetical protein